MKKLVLAGPTASGKTVFYNLLMGEKYSSLTTVTIGTCYSRVETQKGSVLVIDAPGTPHLFMRNTYSWKKVEAFLIFYDTTFHPYETEQWINKLHSMNPQAKLFLIKTKEAKVNHSISLKYINHVYTLNIYSNNTQDIIESIMNKMSGCLCLKSFNQRDGNFNMKLGHLVEF
jgi:GTPase SAR1 family protein